MIRKLCYVWMFAVLLVVPVFSATAESGTPLPQLTSKRLLNDLQITVAAMPESMEDVAIGLVVRYGSAFDPAEKGGVAQLLSRMFLRATTDRSLRDIQSELEYLNATIDVQCDWDGFRFMLLGKRQHLERSLLLLYQVVGEARFEESDFEEIKRSLLEELSRSTDPRKRIHQQMENALFRGTTYGRPLNGTTESVSAITLGDLRHFYRRFFSPGQAALQIVGNVDAAPILQRATRIWGVWVRLEDVPFTFAQPQIPAGRKVLVEDDSNSPSAQFIAGGLFPRREDTDYVHALLAASILQERLNRVLPTSLITVDNEGRRLASPFHIQGQAAADQVVGQILDVQNAIEEIKQNAVSPEELKTAKLALTEDFIRRLGSVEGLCHILLDAELHRLGNNYPSYFLDRVDRCDAEAIRKAANRWFFPVGELLLIRGPLEEMKTRLSVLGLFEPLVP